MKKIIILNKPKGCRLANQLWNYISIYAYSLEIGARCVNFCFYENKKDQITGVRSYDNYYKYFNIPNHKIISLIVNLNTIINRLSQKLRPLNRYVKYIKNKNKIICSGEEMAFYLEPTKNNSIINNKTTKIYFDGWMFRNPKGIEKYRREIIKYFAPKEKFIKKIESKINKLKSKYNHIVGVHIRKGDYKVFLGGKLYFDDREINKILQEYLKEFNKDKDKTCFLACSDEKINMDKFPGLNIIKNNGNMIEDLFILAKTDIIIGSDSTFGAFASYYGDVPFVVFQKPKMDWEYYKDKKYYFENKHNTLTFY
ncbi:hypothetical protein A2331_02715 [Candidatus Falkowbacteria bacterium RIFOXYB2_FULL_34_18]|uniref:Glycosyl transferase family 11 n=1 Tax=Candidatus Falkowbacteria bacterium RIFOXYD2_FULL_34_120 TaxID=1798007 RepID=A0A1F5TST8_9BACT|nr:MAG: hypothetical protein A2331_02715 [Candidatus Falkowbacteria bacterium RIFOXYB2_FULL_34_18]OGF29652.1 MAG: hypothetical protein A2500_00745 [Candidatus Falkowbacteria bacterium RIFOXYC12_FULL_34_55]OGF37379.1 MAG: hypothetical protein A2466_01515 [Candidatus Falkowbacteria bacterium RIFOXYC2_FULL_34_220]OGF39117.1 MAG: hypothetical protein A2515_00165 [Candidatus Falkowbacteria bacterium RIFOXYD12_FULL_34_57]OGF41641.1 MAG: hypothetical protein A2531_06400 [Candidatus Falkowbacteria bact